MALYNFENLSQLEFDCANPIKMLLWEIRPNKALILDDSINMTDLSIETNGQFSTILFNNLKGLNLKSNSKQINFFYLLK